MAAEKAPQTESEEEMMKWAQAYAKEHGFVVNPDVKQAENITRGLIKINAKFGRPYCPCRLRSGDKEKDRAIECPCVFHKDEVSNQGHCHCNLFFKPPVQ